MAKLTVSIDEQVLRRARAKALEQRTSVQAVVRQFLESYGRDDEREHARREILKLARQDRADRGPTQSMGRTWNREDLYEERP